MLVTRRLDHPPRVRHLGPYLERDCSSSLAVMLLYSYGLTGDSWVPLTVALAGTHTVIVPDLRGLRLSSKLEGGLH